MRAACFVVVSALIAASLTAYAEASTVYIIKLKASINPITKDYTIHWLERANQENASLIIIQLDTPGGLLSSMKDIMDKMLASKVPIVVYVSPTGAWAASAGTFITLAADVAAMAPGTTIGAAHPVGIGGEPPPDEEKPSPEKKEEKDKQTPKIEPSKENPASQKITEFSATYARSIAQQKRRKPEAALWAEKAVRESATLTDKEALEKGVVDLVAENIDELIEKLKGYQIYDGGRVIILEEPIIKKEIEMNWKEQLMNYLADPNLVYFLLIIGLYALIYEFFSPGIGIGLAIGGISLLLAFLGLQILPVNLVGLALILLGVVLMILDAFSPTHGILTTGGVISLIAGSFTLFNADVPGISISLWNIVGTVGAVTALFVFLISKGLLVQKKRVTTGMEGMIGTIGKAREDFSDKGTVFVHGEYWEAEAPYGEEIRTGDEVQVVEVRGRRLVVRKTNSRA